MPKFYQTPAGTLSSSEKQWKDDMRAEGIEPKNYTGRKAFEVPVKAVDLMQFLAFHNVNVVNPQSQLAAPLVADGGAPPAPPSVAPHTTVPDLQEQFEAAPLAVQLHLAGMACEAARNGIR